MQWSLCAWLKAACLQPSELAQKSGSLPCAHRWDVLLTRDSKRCILLLQALSHSCALQQPP